MILAQSFRITVRSTYNLALGMGHALFTCYHNNTKCEQYIVHVLGIYFLVRGNTASFT
jgi:hypothetical protein